MNILVCGDSHSNVFKYANKKQNTYKFNVCMMSGATSYGVGRTKSSSNSYKTICDIVTTIKTNNNNKKIIICLGEVDCAFLIWIKSEENNISINNQIKIHIDNLINFINDVLVKKYKYSKSNIILMGAILPVQQTVHKYNRFKNFEISSKTLIDKSQKLRTRKTIFYNKMLNMQCKKYGYKYMDITNIIINKNRVIKKKYKGNPKSNFHLSFAKTYQFWCDKLNMLYNN